MKIAILTVFYPNAKKYLSKFLDSLSKQTYKKFSLLIVNENLKLKLDQKKFPIKIINGYKNDGQKNRIAGLEYCKKRFDIIICADADDTLDKNRVKTILNFFKKSDKKIVFSNAINEIQNFQSYKKKLVTIEDMYNYNLLGFGCMSLKTTLLNNIKFFKNKKIKIYDWWIFSIFLLKLKSVDVLKKSIVKYRNHENNLIGPNNLIFSKKKIIKGFENKIIHYDEMKNYCRKNKLKYKYNIYLKLLKKYKEAYNFYLANPRKYNKYVKKFLNSKKNIFWFENIIPILK